MAQEPQHLAKRYRPPGGHNLLKVWPPDCCIPGGSNDDYRHTTLFSARLAEPPHMGVLYIVMAQRLREWLAEAFAQDAVSQVTLEEATGTRADLLVMELLLQLAEGYRICYHQRVHPPQQQLLPGFE